MASTPQTQTTLTTTTAEFSGAVIKPALDVEACPKNEQVVSAYYLESFNQNLITVYLRPFELLLASEIQ